jgi:hypothetical protein
LLLEDEHQLKLAPDIVQYDDQGKEAKIDVSDKIERPFILIGRS